MNFDLSAITTNAIVIVPIVLAIVQAIKLTGFVKDHFAPLVSIGVGILIGWLGGPDDATLSSLLLSGAIYGLMASGLYSGVKTTMLARSRQKAEQAKKDDRNHRK
jgi:uncharacterized membrane protein (DUF441 family)